MWRNPSEHDYWIDLVYNFGLLSALPLLWLLWAALRSLYRRRGDLRSQPLLTGVAFAFLAPMADNLLKVGMRQPYLGIITFFVWGLLIVRLRVVQRGLP